jgi:hypothetical protein
LDPSYRSILSTGIPIDKKPKGHGDFMITPLRKKGKYELKRFSYPLPSSLQNYHVCPNAYYGAFQISHQLPKFPLCISPFCGWKGREISSVGKIIHLFKRKMRVRRFATVTVIIEPKNSGTNPDQSSSHLPDPQQLAPVHALPAEEAWCDQT